MARNVCSGRGIAPDNGLRRGGGALETRGKGATDGNRKKGAPDGYRRKGSPDGSRKKGALHATRRRDHFTKLQFG
jgi:hypothetical protein